MRKQLASLQKEGRDAVAAEFTGSAAVRDAAPGTVAKLEAALKQKRNAYDLLRSRTKERQRELSTLRDSFR
jgi:hypothetical protein